MKARETPPVGGGKFCPVTRKSTPTLENIFMHLGGNLPGAGPAAVEVAANEKHSNGGGEPFREAVRRPGASQPGFSFCAA